MLTGTCQSHEIFLFSFPALVSSWILAGLGCFQFGSRNLYMYSAGLQSLYTVVYLAGLRNEVQNIHHL